MRIYIVNTNNGLIIQSEDKSGNPKFYEPFSGWALTHKAYEAEDNPTATQLSDLINPIDVTAKRIYLVE